MSFIKIGGLMNIETAKKMIDSSYQLLRGKELKLLIHWETPSFPMIWDGEKIVGPDFNVLHFSPSPILENFLNRYEEIWDELKKEVWNEDDAKQLISYDNDCWNQFLE